MTTPSSHIHPLFPSAWSIVSCGDREHLDLMQQYFCVAVFAGRGVIFSVHLLNVCSELQLADMHNPVFFERHAGFTSLF